MDYHPLEDISLWPVVFDGGMERLTVDEHLRQAASPNMPNLRCPLTKSFHFSPVAFYELVAPHMCSCVVQLDDLAGSSSQPCDHDE
jgi:hypothetical protein